MEDIVMQFILNNFVIEMITIIDFPRLPFGKRIINKDFGEALYYLDTNVNKVRWIYQFQK